MSFPARTWAWGVTGITPAQKLVLITLADSHNERANVAWPSLNLIAERCNISKSTVRRHLSRLEELGLIRSETRLRDDGGTTSNLYHLDMEGGCQNDRGGCQSREQGGVSTVTTPKEPLEEPSFPNGKATDLFGEQPSNERQELYDTAKPLLEAQGTPAKQTGAIIGRWLNAAGEDVQAVLAAVIEGKGRADLKSWVFGSLKPRDGPIDPEAARAKLEAERIACLQ